jgi:hypothetical protein
VICKDGTDWQPTDEQLLNWQHAYPEVNVFAELNVMAVWLDSNEPKRKTERGMPRFVNSWLSRANQKGGSPFAQQEQEATGKKPMKQWTQLDDLTHDFMQSEAFRQSCLEKYGQYVTYDGQRVTR